LKLSDGAVTGYASGSGTDTLVFNRPNLATNAVVAVDTNGGAIIASEAGAKLRLAQLTLPDKAMAK